MCFYATKNQKPKTATEDIVCWKIGHKIVDGFVPFYYDDYLYSAGEPQPREKLVKIVNRDMDYVISRGYHSWATLKKAAKDRLGMPHVVIGRFIIPKGTTYYENKSDKDYVSETIIWTGEIVE